MPKLKLTKSAVEAASPKERDYDLRDTLIPGFMVKVTPAGRKVFMLNYQTRSGIRRKPSIGRYGELTVEQARKIAQDWLADVRIGNDPSSERTAMRAAPTVKELCDRFIEDYSKHHNKPSTVETNQMNIKNHILPRLGKLKVPDVTRADVFAMMSGMSDRPIIANRTLACLRKMFNLAEVWGYRPDGSNPCRHVQKYPEKGETRFITDDELRKLYVYLNRADAEGLEHPILTLAIRLQFEFAARMSEILNLRWDWVDFESRRVTWPDSKTGDMTKPLSEEGHRLLSQAPRIENSPYVCPAIFDPEKPMTEGTYHAGWRRILERAGVPHVGTHGIRHRAATDIANSGVPVKVGMALTAHKTVQMFMRYVHNEDNPLRAAAEAVAARRREIVLAVPAETAKGRLVEGPSGQAKPSSVEAVAPSRTSLGNYRPYRHRKDKERTLPPANAGRKSSKGTAANG
ncbi:tyrosine-type recombinase/integrase [Consotaella salsifontis]|uniref:Site-specific recombinase XerD n=1 Tax=Consotaella salsifontis TaxID=1365950 RepID=A0A1T4NHQ9_9HYPH|nr:site-specific integrase [Consotaella salsifontis]SJZ78675.1 Site-specific recombinase XerD [Consotaella salsifontis]